MTRRDLCRPARPPADSTRVRDELRGELAAACEAAFVDASRSLPVPPAYQPGRWAGDWLRLADELLDAGLAADVAGFVRTQFLLWPNPSTSPTPRQCHGPAAMRRYQSTQQDLERRVEELVVQLGHEKQAMIRLMAELRGGPGAAWSDDDRVAHVLLSDGPLSLLFRYTTALVAGLPDVAEHWREGATRQYLADRRAYDEAWGGQLPADLSGMGGRP